MMQLIQRTVFCVFFFQISLIKDIEGEYVLLLIANEFEVTWLKKSFCRQSDPLKRIFLTNTSMFYMEWRHFCPLTREKKLSQYLTKTNTFWWWIVVYKNISNQYVAFYAFEMFKKINILIWGFFRIDIGNRYFQISLFVLGGLLLSLCLLSLKLFWITWILFNM